MRTFESLDKLLVLCGAAFAALASFDAVHASNINILHSFSGGSDGYYPVAGLIRDSSGNLYGTTQFGGVACNGAGCGTVFKLAPDGTETVLYAFTGGNDGEVPRAGLIRDSSGYLYGTTFGGGTKGGGTVFKVDPHGTETVLHSFTSTPDGFQPLAGLVMDASGNLFGTTSLGGVAVCCQSGCGTVFKLDQRGTETVLYAFAGGSDGDYPAAGLIMDAKGNLYGTTSSGGGSSGCLNYFGCGTVFKLAPDGTETVLHAFTGGNDGDDPLASLIKDSEGNLFGTTAVGGNTGCNDPYGCGTVFELAPDGTETVLHAFTDGTDGAFPEGGLTMDKRGNLYGTTNSGGDCRGRSGCGTVFKLTPDGTKTVLGDLVSRVGRYPEAGLIKDGAGNLDGTAEFGGASGYGTVFKLKK
jgi:uncharacterized repeat protein (TIGR03803 family)